MTKGALIYKDRNLSGAGASLPPITEEDNGKVLKAEDSQWIVGEVPAGPKGDPGEPGPQGERGIPTDVQINGISIIEDEVANITESNTEPVIKSVFTNNIEWTEEEKTAARNKIGAGTGEGSADVIELTKQEYDALPDTKLTDDKIYFINDYSERYNLKNNYSTEEQLIGRWIDGKPLYQKTFDFGKLPNKSTKEIMLDSTIKFVISFNGVCINTTLEGYSRPLPFSSYSYNDSIRVDANAKSLRILTNADWSTYIGYITIQYTKTTD